MKIPVYIFGVLVTIVNVECISNDDAISFCYEKIKVADGSYMCLTKNKKCTLDDLSDWLFLYNGTKKLQDLSWENRRFTCFHACMMTQRGEMKRGKIVLDKYIENLAAEYELRIDDFGRAHIDVCRLKANAVADECSVAAVMGECVTERWEYIDKNDHRN